MKKWLVENFLPMWAKETVLEENRQLKRQLKKQEVEVKAMRAYLDGLEMGLRAAKRVASRSGGQQ